MLRDVDTQVIAALFLFDSRYLAAQHQDRLRQLSNDEKFFGQLYGMIQLQTEVFRAQIVEHRAHPQALVAGSSLQHNGGKRPSDVWGCGTFGGRATAWRDLGTQSWGNLS